MAVSLVPVGNDVAPDSQGGAGVPSTGPMLMPMPDDTQPDNAAKGFAMGGERGGRSYDGAPAVPPGPVPVMTMIQRLMGLSPEQRAQPGPDFVQGVKSMGLNTVDNLVAGAQGTSPNVGDASNRYLKAPVQAQAMFDETGQVPDERNMVALRDPQSGKYGVYYRGPDSNEGRLTGAARSITNSLVTAGPPGVGAAISDAVTPLASGAAAVGNRLGLGSAETRAISQIGGALAADEKAGGPGALDITGKLVGGTGKQPLAPVDVAGENVQNLFGQALRVPGPGRQSGTAILNNRDAGAGSRLSADVNEALGGDKTAFQTANDLMAARQRAAAPAYQAAGIPANPADYASAPIVDNPAVTRLLDKSADVKGAIAQAKKLPDYADLPDNSMVLLDKAYKNIGGQANEAKIAGNGEGARDLNSLRGQLLDAITGGDPAHPYRQALNAYSGPSGSMQAITDGAGLFKMKPEEIAQKMTALAPGDRDFFRLGAESAIRENIAKTGPAGDEARALLKNNYVQQQLRPLFGTQADFDKVISAAKNESMMAATKYKAMGNSMTAGRLAQDASGEGSLLRPIAEAGAAFGANEPILGAKAVLSFGQALKARANGMTPSVAEQIVKLLGDPAISQNPEMLYKALMGPQRGGQLPIFQKLMPPQTPAPAALFPPRGNSP